jgi:hypothetical protein
VASPCCPLPSTPTASSASLRFLHRLADEESEYFSAEDREMLRSDPVKLRELVDQALPVLPMSKRRFPGFVNDRIQYGRMGE